MIEITDTAAVELRKSLVEGYVIRMFLAAMDATGAHYGLQLGDPAEDDVIFESNGIEIRMTPEDADILGKTIIDYVDDEMGKGFLIHGPSEEGGCCGF
jgi:Fe-S cluster assembly iron-binding protein IscA